MINFICPEMCKAPITEERCWKWLGHVLQNNDDSLPKLVVIWTPQGNRRKGRVKEIWRTTIEMLLSNRLID